MTTEPADRNEPRPRQGLDAWLADIAKQRASPEGKAMAARRNAEDAALTAWLAAEPDLVVTQHGGYAPEVWEGSVDGHTLYFRERPACGQRLDETDEEPPTGTGRVGP